MVLSRTTATRPLPPLDCAGQMTGRWWRPRHRRCRGCRPALLAALDGDVDLPLAVLRPRRRPTTRRCPRALRARARSGCRWCRCRAPGCCRTCARRTSARRPGPWPWPPGTTWWSGRSRPWWTWHRRRWRPEAWWWAWPWSAAPWWRSAAPAPVKDTGCVATRPSPSGARPCLVVEPVVEAVVVGVAAVVDGVLVPGTVVLVLPGTVVVVPGLVVGVGPSCWTTGRKVSRPVWPMSASASSGRPRS